MGVRQWTQAHSRVFPPSHLLKSKEKWRFHHLEQFGTAQRQRQVSHDAQYRRLRPEENGGHRWTRDEENNGEFVTQEAAS